MTVCRLVVTLMLLLLPFSAGAQQATTIPRIGILSPAPIVAASASPFSALRDKLRELGYIEGQNIALEFRLADGHLNRLPELAADLVRLRVDVIVTDGGDAVARVAAAATKTIPIVMGTSTDPVASGLVASLAQPGGNVTGFILPYADLAGKRLQLLKEMVPTVNRVAVLWDADSGEPQLRAAAAAAPALGVHLESLPVRARADLDAAFRPVAGAPGPCCSWPRGGCPTTGRRSPNAYSGIAYPACSSSDLPKPASSPPMDREPRTTSAGPRSTSTRS